MILGEYGNIIRLGVDEDISNYTNSLLLISPAPCFNITVFEVSDGLTVGSVNKIVNGISFTANQYIEYEIENNDIDIAGTWKVQLKSITPSDECKYSTSQEFEVTV